MNAAAWLRRFAYAALAVLGFAAGAAPAEERPVAEVLSWVGPSDQATLDRIVAGQLPLRQWVPGAVQPLGAGQSLWIALRLVDASHDNSHVVEVPLPILDEVSLHQRRADGTWAGESAGDRVPMANWPIAGRYPTFALRDGTQQLYVHVRHATPIVVPLQVTRAEVHAQRTQLEYLSLGVCLGAMALLVAGSFMRAWVLRDHKYLMFSAYSLVSLLAVVASSGIAAHLLWGGSGHWVDAAPGCLALIGGTIACYLVVHLASTAGSAQFLARALGTLTWIGPPLAITYLLVERRIGLVLLGLYLLSASIFGIMAAVLTWQRGDAVGRWMLFGSTPLAAAVLVTVARSLSWVPTSWLTEYALVMALMLDLPLLLGAIRRRTEQRGSVRLRELASQDHDALTGLPRSRLFYARVGQALARWQQHREAAAVLMIEVSNLDAITRGYGAEAAEESLLRAVIKIRAIARDVDMAGRLAPARFGLVLEGAQTQDAVSLFGTRLIAAGLMTGKGEPELVFHVVAVVLPEYSPAAEELLRNMSAMLTAMSPRTRRPLRFLTANDVPIGSRTSDPAPSWNDESERAPLTP